MQQITPRLRIGGSHHIGHRTFSHHPPATHPRTGAHVDHMIRPADGVFVVLHHHQGVALVAQLVQGVEQDLVVAWVQADGRLVEHVTYALQVGAKLRRQADALRLAPAEAGGTPVQRQVAQAHLLQKLQTAPDFRQQVAGDVGLAHAQAAGGSRCALHRTQHRARHRQRCLLQGLHPQAHVAHAQSRQRGDALPVELDRPRRGIQARAAATGAGLVGHVFQLGLGQALLAAFLVVVAYGIVERLALLARELHTRAHTVRAPAVLAVVREQARVQFGIAGGAHRAGTQRGKHLQPPYARRRVSAVERGLQALQSRQHMYHALAVLQRTGQQLPPFGFGFGCHVQAAHGQLDGVLLETVDAREALRGQEFAIHPQMGMAAQTRPIGQLGIDPFAVDHQRCQHADVLATEGRHPLRQDAVGGLWLHRGVVVDAVLGAQLHVQQAQEVPDFGGGADGRFAPAARQALLDRHGGWNAIDGVHLGPTGGLHDAAGVGVEAFQIAALAFAEQDVERQRGLARTADAGDDVDLAPGDIDRQALEVVLSGVDDADGVGVWAGVWAVVGMWAGGFTRRPRGREGGTPRRVSRRLRFLAGAHPLPSV